MGRWSNLGMLQTAPSLVRKKGVNQMDVGQLRTIVSVAELGSLNKAADRLRIAQPALSRQVRMLEAELGVQLFKRHGRGMVPTAAGLKVLAHAVRIINEIGAIRTEVEQEKRAGEIVLGVPSNVATILTVPIVRSFAERRPGAKLRIVSAFSGFLAEWLQRKELHLSIMHEQDRSTMFRLRKILVDRVYAISAAGLLDAPEGQLRLADIAEQPLLLPSSRQNLRRIIEAAAEADGLTLNVRYEADDFHTLRDLTLAGMGIALLPPIGFERYIEAGVLSAYPIVDREIRRNLVLGHLVDTPPSAIGRDLGEIVMGVTAQLVDEGRWIGQV